MDGKIDEVRIWNIARTQSQIDMYKDCAITTAEPNLVAVYNLNETLGLIAADSSGNMNNGSLENGPVWTSSPVALICELGIEEISISQLNVYPNPFESEIILNDSFFYNANYNIFNIMGQLVLQGESAGYAIATESLASGTYVLEVKIAEKIGRVKVVKL